MKGSTSKYPFKCNRNLLGLILCLFVSASCGKAVERTAPTAGAAPATAQPAGGVVPAPPTTVPPPTTYQTSNPDSCPALCDCTGGSGVPGSYTYHTATGWIVLGSPYTYGEPYVVIGSSAYYVGFYTSSQVRQIIQYLPPGTYTIRLNGYFGFESGHYPNTSAQYPVVHITQTY